MTPVDVAREKGGPARSPVDVAGEQRELIRKKYLLFLINQEKKRQYIVIDKKINIRIEICSTF